MLEINTIYNSRIEDMIDTFDHNSIDLIVTSPPYGIKRQDIYGGVPVDEYADWLLGLSKKFMRLLKPTGSFILNIKEGVNSGRRQEYAMEYLLKMARLGWWIETYIWHKTNPFPTGNKKRLKDAFEYCYHFAKTKDYKFYPNNCLVPANPKWLEDNKRRKNKGKHFVSNGSGMNMSIRTTETMSRPSNVLVFPTNTMNINHPATFPIALPSFFIQLMTKENDIVFDPFIGSGTTALACIKNKRNYIGVDCLQEYVDLTLQRIRKETAQ